MSEENKETVQKSPIAEREEEILDFWQKNNIFKKSLEKPSPKGNFIFYDGPPFATGLPHYGHILASTIKDAVPRYKTMQGYHVARRWGWDTHGLPVENIVEKDLKIAGKKQIEEFGIDKFNEHARSKVLDFVHEWKRTVDRIARWVDFDGAYLTMDNSYIESVWWALKELHTKDLIYEGTRVLPYCPRCETPISNSEIAMDNSYKDITDISVYVKFFLKDEPDTAFLVWTTTPWTLPGNFALAVNADVSYVKVKNIEEKTEYFILAKDLFEKHKEKFKNPEIVTQYLGKDLVGKAYTPVFNYFVPKDFKNKENAWHVYAGDFVTTTDGTGIVHIAPAYGEDDMNLARKENIPFIHHVTRDGKFNVEVTDFAGIAVKPKDDHQSGDVHIIKYLAHAGMLFAKEKIVHSYPHCYRCETPVLYYAIPAWFIKVQSVKSRILELNEKIHWIPDHLKEGRFKKIAENAPDWNISRNRFWASPLPIWKCEKCLAIEFIGGLGELKKKTKRNNYFVMRHGEGDHNVQNVLSSNPKNPHHLTENGINEAQISAQALKDKNIDVIVVSPFVRTKETADIVAEQIEFTGKVVVDERLGEFNFGDLNGKDIEEYHRYYNSVNERFSKRLPNGEHLGDLRNRIGEFLYDIDSTYEKKNILIVTHNGPATMLFALAEGGDEKRILELWGMDQVFMNTGQEMPLDFAFIPHNREYALDYHRPYSDEIHWPCSCGGIMQRTPEVIDCWFESGSMPFAQVHYPVENKQWFHDNFPSDFVAEYIAQTRTWFYYMLAVSTMLFDDIPFKHIVTTGTVLAADGQKMSKSKGNFPDPWILFNKYSVDALRYYLLSSPLLKAEDLNFSEKDVDDINKKIIMRLQNVYTFYETYRKDEKAFDMSQVENVLDIWIFARLTELGKTVTVSLDAYELDRAAKPIMNFIDDLSTWYLRRSRDRFKGDDEHDKQSALYTTHQVLFELSKLLAPFMPFLAEDMYLKVKGDKPFDMAQGKESVHLETWTDFSVQTLNTRLLDQMKDVRTIVSYGLEARSKANIKVRQPLQKLTIKNAELATQTGLLELIRDEVNVKDVVSDAGLAAEVMLDTTLTPELKLEGQARELIRGIQDMRKKAGLNPHDVVILTIATDTAGKSLIESFKADIMKTAQIKNIQFADTTGETLTVDDLSFIVFLSNV